MTDEGRPRNRGSESWQAMVARAEINGRRVNEAIERGREGEAAATFVCECGHLGCSTTISLSVTDYESVRTNFDRFLVAPGHEIESVDRVVERHDDHLVVIKAEGEARELAAASDERPR